MIVLRCVIGAHISPMMPTCFGLVIQYTLVMAHQEGVDTLKDLAALKSSSSEQSKLLELPATTGKRTGGPCSAVRWLVEHIHANPGVALVLTGPMT